MFLEEVLKLRFSQHGIDNFYYRLLVFVIELLYEFKLFHLGFIFQSILLDTFPMSRNFYYIYTRYLGSWLAISDSKGSLTHTATATTPGADAVIRRTTAITA
jgi:hypothetical protein